MNKGRMNKPRGQGMVEFALVLIVLIVIVAGMIDVAPLIGNLLITKQMSARGARAASVYLADGFRTCQGDVYNAMGNPPLISATWTATISPNCTNDPNQTLTTGEKVSVLIDVDYKPMFWGGFGYPPKDTVSHWPFSIGTIDIAR